MSIVSRHELVAHILARLGAPPLATLTAKDRQRKERLSGAISVLKKQLRQEVIWLEGQFLPAQAAAQEEALHATQALAEAQRQQQCRTAEMRFADAGRNGRLGESMVGLTKEQDLLNKGRNQGAEFRPPPGSCRYEAQTVALGCRGVKLLGYWGMHLRTWGP